MNSSKITAKLLMGILTILILFPSNVKADLTKEQTEDIANFAIALIEKGNERRDEKGYPLMVYALSNNWNTCIEIRRSGYQEELYHVKNNAYHKRNGQYLDLGMKWCMDCGDYISYVYKTTLGFDMFLEDTNDPWHIRDIYADANKGKSSEYFEFVYKNVPISTIKEENLQKGDIVVRLGSRENHGLIYVGENMQTAHASRNAIKYNLQPVILGFDVVQLNRFYKSSTIVSIVRVKNGIVPFEQEVNGVITWPDTGEKEDLLNRTVIVVLDEKEEKLNEELEEIKQIESNYLSVEMLGKVIKDNSSKSKKVLDYQSEVFQNEVFDWVLIELKRFLMQIKP